MDAAYGEDCVVPLDVVLQGFRMVHAEDAFAYDKMDSSPAGEFQTRVRMTLRNWQGTWSRSELLNPLRHPGYAFALWSHKILRWLSPVFLICATISVLLLAINGSPFFIVVGAGLLVFYGSGLIGWVAERKGIRLPLLSTIFSFLLANLGFLGGLWKALKGRRVTAYR